MADAQTQAQKPLATPDAQAATSRRTRLILKDGSYQIVMSYRVVGKLVRYVSAERGGAEEEIPLELVDLEATRRYEARRATPEAGQTAILDPELLKEEADRASLTPRLHPISASLQKTASLPSTPIAAPLS